MRILPDAQGVTLVNDSLFDDLRGYTLCWQLTRDGSPHTSGTLSDAAVPAGGRRAFRLPLPVMDEPGEYALLCTLCQKAPTLWAEAGYAQMYGQTVVATVKGAPAVSAQPYAISVGDVNAGAYAGGVESLFSYAEGGPVALRRQGLPPALNFAPRPSLYRACTDNDRGNKFAQATALWMAFTELATPGMDGLLTDGGILRAAYTYALPALTKATVRTEYEALSAGCWRVTATFSGGAGLPDLPTFGLAFRLPCALTNIRYYGMGPEENYIDRCAGAVLGIHETDVARNLTPYLKPQACGNRMGVRWMELTDKAGHGLRIRMAERPLEIEALPCSQAELTAALHREELPARAYTWLDVAMARLRIGRRRQLGRAGAPALPPARGGTAAILLLCGADLARRGAGWPPISGLRQEPTGVVNEQTALLPGKRPDPFARQRRGRAVWNHYLSGGPLRVTVRPEGFSLGCQT